MQGAFLRLLFGKRIFSKKYNTMIWGDNDGVRQQDQQRCLNKILHGLRLLSD